MDDSESFEFPLCGILTDVEIEETGWLMLVKQGRASDVYARAHLHNEVVNTNIATGVSVRLVRDAVENDVRIVRGAGDLITITAKSPFRERDYNADGSLAFFTAGMVTWEVVIDTLGTDDLEDDVFVSEEWGGFVGRDGRADVDFCAWYTGQTS